MLLSMLTPTPNYDKHRDNLTNKSLLLNSRDFDRIKQGEIPLIGSKESEKHRGGIFFLFLSFLPSGPFRFLKIPHPFFAFFLFFFPFFFLKNNRNYLEISVNINVLSY